MPIENLSVDHHQQDTGYYCGAACAQMVLNSIGAGLLDQDDLYNDNHSHSVTEAGWATAPDGLQWTMNDRSTGPYFALYSPTTEESISRKLCWTIHHYSVAPIALVFGAAHWIVVKGCDTSASPTGSVDTSYNINGFYVNNPWPPVPSGGPPPHSGTDGCGTGGDRGIENEHISYTQWQSTYMTGVSFGHWNGQHVAVCDPEPPPVPKRARLQRKRLPGYELINLTTAADFAITGLREAGLYERPGGWQNTLQKAHTGEPQLVQRLDRADSFYYIVPMLDEANDTVASVCVDARFGDYLQAAIEPEVFRGGRPAQVKIMPSLPQEAVIGKLSGRRIDFGENVGRIQVRKEILQPYSVLVWKPCLESLSPLFPFRMVILGSQRLYVRTDGEIFTKLHDDVRGI